MVSLTPENSDSCHCLLHYTAHASWRKLVRNPTPAEERKFHVALRKAVEENAHLLYMGGGRSNSMKPAKVIRAPRGLPAEKGRSTMWSTNRRSKCQVTRENIFASTKEIPWYARRQTQYTQHPKELRYPLRLPRSTQLIPNPPNRLTQLNGCDPDSLLVHRWNYKRSLTNVTLVTANWVSSRFHVSSLVPWLVFIPAT